MHKIYTGFVSSVYTGMEAFREAAIEKLLRKDIFPFCMEHFTVSGQEDDNLKKMIDASDIFILLLGNKYGSLSADNKRSWTEVEYDHAMAQKKHILTLICTKELYDLLSDSDNNTITEENCNPLGVDFAQFQFAKKTGNLRILTLTTEEIRDRIDNCFNHPENYTGWTRPLQGEALRQWQEANKTCNLGGLWYHVHLNQWDESYIRVGTVQIKQDFSPENYKTLEATGINHSVNHYNSATGKLHENEMEGSKFTARYIMDENGAFTGIYHSRRTFNGTFDNKEVEKKENRGIHDFTLILNSENTELIRIDGDFHDIAPSPKRGRIFLFRTEEGRNQFLLDYREEHIKIK